MKTLDFEKKKLIEMCSLVLNWWKASLLGWDNGLVTSGDIPYECDSEDHILETFVKWEGDNNCQDCSTTILGSVCINIKTIFSYIEGLMQKGCDSNALAMEYFSFIIEPSIWEFLL